MIFVFTKAHKLDRVQHNKDDEIDRTPRMGDWLISQGVPLRMKDGQSVPQPAAPVVAKAAPVPPRPVFAQPVKPRWSCCGKRT